MCAFPSRPSLSQRQLNSIEARLSAARGSYHSAGSLRTVMTRGVSACSNSRRRAHRHCLKPPSRTTRQCPRSTPLPKRPRMSLGRWPAEIFAPPAFAPIAPSSARKHKDAIDTTGTSALAGDTITMSKGMAAPTANVAADVSAACTGRAVVVSEIPSSSREPSRHLSPSADRRPAARAPVDASFHVDVSQLVAFKPDILAQLPMFTGEISLLRVRL